MEPSGIKSITICVDYDDLLAVTLPRNKRHFDRTLVVTAPHDRATQLIAEREGCETYITDAFYRDGAAFNKGAAMEEGFDILGRDGWICIWDADIVMPESIIIPAPLRDCLYCPDRHVLANPSLYRDSLTRATLPVDTPACEFPGYFQLFHASAVDSPWYGTNWSHAGGCDSDFQSKFAKDKLKRPPFKVLHLGPTVEADRDFSTRIGANWFGRTTKRIDTGQTPDGSGKHCATRNAAIQHRRAAGIYGLVDEQIRGAKERPRTPRRMSFFWSGPMSWLRFLTISTFIQHNHEWEVHLYQPRVDCAPKPWRTHEDDDNSYRGKDYRECLPSSVITHVFDTEPGLPAAHACDLFQWQLLGSHGGFYADMDIIWLQPLEPMREAIDRADVMFCLESGVLAIGFFSVSQGCRMFRDFSRACRWRGGKANYQQFGTNMIYRFCGISQKVLSADVGFRTIQKLRDIYPQLDIVTIPDTTVYPFDWRQIADIFERKRPVSRDAFGLHWFGGDPLARHYNNRLTPDNWSRYPNTLTRCLERLEV